MKRALLAVAFLSLAARADTLLVPADFASIQAAIDAAVAGDVVLVSAGTYEETVLIDGKTDLTLRGKGKVILHGGDVDTAVVTITGGGGVTVERLRFEQPTLAAVDVTDCADARILSCRVEDSVGNAFRAALSPEFVVERCQVFGTGGPAVRIEECEGSLVSRCRIDDAGTTGVTLTDSEGGRVERCTILRPASFGVLVGIPDASSSCSVIDNVITEAGGGGIRLAGGLGLVRGNKLVRPAAVGVQVDGAGASATIEDNRVVQVDGTGLIVDGDEAVVRGNRVVKPVQSGLIVDGDEPTLTDNVVSNAGEIGVLLQSDISAGFVFGNDVLHPALWGFEILCSGLIVQQNRAIGAGEDGFFLTNGPNQILQNEAHGSGDFDIQDGSMFTNFYFGNDFEIVAP